MSTKLNYAMKTSALLLCLLFLNSLAFGQAFQYTDHKSLRTSYSKVLPIGDEHWLALNDVRMFDISPSTKSFVQKFDASGELIWEYDTGWGTVARDMLVTEDNRIVLFSSEVYCDYIESTDVTILILDEDANQQSEHVIGLTDIMGLPPEIKACSNHSNWYIGAYTQYSQSHIIAYNEVQGFLWSSPVDLSPISHMAPLGNHIVALGASELVVLDSTGVVLESISFSGPIKALEASTQGLFVVLPDAVMLLSHELTWNEIQTDLEETGPPYFILHDTETIHFLYKQAVHVLDTNFNHLYSVEKDSLPGFDARHASMNTQGYAVVGSRYVTTTWLDWVQTSYPYEASTAVLQHIPITGHTDSNITDAALRHLELFNYQPNNHSVLAGFYLVNEGNIQLDSVQVNFVGNLNSISCHLLTAAQNYYDLGLAPGDSIWLEMTGIQYQYPFGLTPADSGKVEYCIYAAQPNRLYDRDSDNDHVCALYDTTLGISELARPNISLYPNPARSTVQWFCEDCHTVAGLEVYSISGNMVMEVAASDFNTGIFDVSTLESGVYLVRARSNATFSKTQKIIVLRE